MRLNEERELMYGGILSILILLTLFCIYLSDLYINEQNNHIENQRLDMLETMNYMNNHLISNCSFVETANYIDISNSSIVNGSAKQYKIDNIENLNPDDLRYYQAWNAVVKGEMTLSDFYHNESVQSSKKYQSARNTFDKQKKELLELKEQGTIWIFLKKLFLALELSFILANGYVYYDLMKKISLRIK